MRSRTTARRHASQMLIFKCQRVPSDVPMELKASTAQSTSFLQEYTNPNSEKYNEMVEAIRKELNFTTLKYHRLDDLIEAIGLEPCKVCTYCFDGRE